MKTLRISLIIFIACINIVNINAQTNKLSEKFIWNTLYPDKVDKKYFDSENRLIKKITNGTEQQEFRVQISNIFYYNVGTQQKAIVILFAYEIDDNSGDVVNCHACYPEFEIATFALTDNQWTKQRFVQSWEGARGAWGEGAEVSLETYKKKKCLVLKHSYGNHGEFYDYIDYYDVETLKKIRTKTKKI